MPLFQTLPPDAATMPSEAGIGFQTAAKNRRFSAGFIMMPRRFGAAGFGLVCGAARGAVPVCRLCVKTFPDASKQPFERQCGFFVAVRPFAVSDACGHMAFPTSFNAEPPFERRPACQRLFSPSISTPKDFDLCKTLKAAKG